MNILKETQGFLNIFFILGNPLGIGTNHITLPTNPAGEHRERSGMREVIGLGGWCFEWRTIFHHQRSRFSRE